jgi:uncharacterized protein (DUF305 family)
MNTTNTIGMRVVFLIIGFAAAWLIWGRTPVASPSGMHMMPDGSMMAHDMSMGDMMASMNAALAGKTGDAFDQAFLYEMIVHHEGAVEMARLALTNAKHQEIKDLATAIIAAQNKEIDQMKVWQTAWYTGR